MLALLLLAGSGPPLWERIAVTVNIPSVVAGVQQMKKLSVLALCSALLIGCSQSEITVTLEAAVDAAIAADSIARPQDAPYLAVATSCLDQAETILASSATPQIQATEISAACAAAVASANGNLDVQAVAAALNAFLKAVEAVNAAVLSHSQAVNAFADPPHAKMSKRKLADIRKKIDKLKAMQKGKK